MTSEYSFNLEESSFKITWELFSQDSYSSVQALENLDHCSWGLGGLMPVGNLSVIHMTLFFCRVCNLKALVSWTFPRRWKCQTMCGMVIYFRSTHTGWCVKLREWRLIFTGNPKRSKDDGLFPEGSFRQLARPVQEWLCVLQLARWWWWCYCCSLVLRSCYSVSRMADMLF